MHSSLKHLQDILGSNLHPLGKRREPKKGSHRAVPFIFLLSCLLLSPLQAFSLPPSVSLCLDFLPAPSGPFCFHPEKGSRTNLAHPTCEGGSSEEHKTIGISGGSKHLGKKHQCRHLFHLQKTIPVSRCLTLMTTLF